jgi:hypothetical protein
MNEAPGRVTHGIIGVQGEAPMVEKLAITDDVRSFVSAYPLGRWHARASK